MRLEDIRQLRYVPDLLPKGTRILPGQRDLRIDLGCGINKVPDHLGFDADPEADADYFCDLNQGIPLEDNCCRAIVAGHFLEHVDDPEFMVFEMWRVCQPGAVVKINVPALNWDGAYAIEHKSFIAEHFFRANRTFITLFDPYRMYYQSDPEAIATVRKYLPDITDEDAGMLFYNVRRQLLVECRPREGTKEAAS